MNDGRDPCPRRVRGEDLPCGILQGIRWSRRVILHVPGDPILHICLSPAAGMIFRCFLITFLLIPAVLAESGAELYASGDYTGAISVFEQDLGRDTASRAQILNNIGTCYVALGEPEKALSYYTQAVGSDISYGRGWINLGVVQERLGKKDEALASYDQAGVSDPAFFAEAMVKKGSLLTSEGDTDKALLVFRQAEPKAAGQVFVDLYTGIGAVEFIRKNTDAAEEAFLKATEADPDGAALAFTNLGVLRISQGRYADAKILLETAARNDRAGQTNANEYLKKLAAMAGEGS
ncbi:MAG: tetratricopeptide repeat protein [Methanospirillum sp.]|nr:tetratricopeptide repeat protein [Methanospirillum sp.]